VKHPLFLTIILVLALSTVLGCSTSDQSQPLHQRLRWRAGSAPWGNRADAARSRRRASRSGSEL